MSAYPVSPEQRTAVCPLRSTAAFVRSATTAGWATLVYGLICYMAFFTWFLYAIGWLGNWIVPWTIDAPARGGSTPTAALINIGLIALFVVQHTVMARPGFKRRWTRIIPASIERSTFVLLAAACMWLLVLAWRPMPDAVWLFTHPAAVWGLSALSLAGWGIVLYSSFCINHFDLFGLRQVWLRFIARPNKAVGFRLRGPYRLVRHPLMVGFLIAFWATPHMTTGRLLFAALFTGYIFMGTWFEERDLVREHGTDYLEYCRKVRGLVPLPRML